MSATKKTRKSRAKRVTAAAPVQLPVIRITNPFNPREFVHETLEWRPRKTLVDYFPLATVAQSVVSINGKIIPAEQFSTTYLDKTDNLVVCPVPTGGDGDGKQILSIVAMIAVAVFAPYAAGALYSAAGGTFVAANAGLMISAMTVGITMAGSMLVHSLLAPSTPTSSSSSLKTSQSYGIDGAKNTSLEGIPVPVCYGKFRLAGNILGLHVDNVADDSQILYMLLSAGEGRVSSITDIFINDNPLVDFKDVSTEIRLGLPNQPVIPWFNENIVPTNLGQKLTTDWFYHTTSTRVDKVRLDFVCPGGLFTANTKSGDLDRASVGLEVQYRPADDLGGAWDLLPTTSSEVGTSAVEAHVHLDPGVFLDQTVWRLYYFGLADEVIYIETPHVDWYYANTITPVTDAGMLDWLANNAPTVANAMESDVHLVNSVPFAGSASQAITASKRSAVRRSFSSATLVSQKYELRVRRTAAQSTLSNVVDETYLSDINEITQDTMTYPNTALVGLKIRLTDQLSSMPKVTYLHGGRVVQVYGIPEGGATEQWYESASQNPAWVVWDMLTNKRFGGATPLSRLDFAAFRMWAAHCDSENLKWNGVIDSEMNVWDACQLVLRVGHAQLVNVGTRYSVVVEKASTPVMMFSVANMVKDSYKETWLSVTDRANEIDVSFFDRTGDYKQRTIKIYDPAETATGAKQRSSAITLYGVTDHETAYKEAQFQLNLNRYVLKTVSFSAPLEAVACSVGDLILVQSDMTAWAEAGRFDAGSTSSVVKLDRQVTMGAGKQYKLLVAHDALQRYSGTVYNVVGSSLFLTGFSAASPVKRINIGGRDLRVAGTFEGGGSGSGVIIDDDIGGISTGSSYTLWDTDVIEEFNVVNAGAPSSTLTLQSAMSSAPAQFVNWMFGEVDKVKKPFRIKSISGSHEYQRDITAVQYDERVYDFGRYGGDMPVIPPSEAVIGPVRGLQVYEETYVSGANIVSKVVGSWQPPLSGFYGGADVYVSVNDGPMVKEMEVKNKTSASGDANRGDKLTVKVVAFDIFGKRSAYSLAPEVTYTVMGEITGIDVGDVTGAQFLWSGRDCKITWRYNSKTHSYEFGSEPNGADAGALDPHFKDYEVRVYDKTGKKLRRTEYVKDSSYTYTYEKNFADGITRHLVFEIRMRDIFNNLGEPTTLDAYNPPPRVTGANTTTSFESATLSYTHTNDPDFAGAIIWLSRNDTDLADLDQADDFRVYDGPDSSVLLSDLMFNADYYFRIAAYDVFGTTELLPTNTLHFKTTHLDVNAIAEGVLKDSHLIPELQARINLVDGPYSQAGTVAARILAEATARGTAIANESSARETADGSLATQINAVSAVTGANTAAIATETTARTTATTALSTQINAVTAKSDANTAAIVTETNARTSAVSAVSSNVTTLTSTVGSHTTSIQSQQYSLDGLSGQYTVKIDNNGYISGFGLASYPTGNGGRTSEFVVSADTFAVMRPGYPGVYPFTIGTVNGVTRTIIQSALIGDASINNAKIGNAEVNTLSIAGNAVTVPLSATGTTSCSVNVSGGAGEGYTCFALCGSQNPNANNTNLMVNGTPLIGANAAGAPTVGGTFYVPAGSTYSVACSAPGGVACWVLVLVTKR